MNVFFCVLLTRSFPEIVRRSFQRHVPRVSQRHQYICNVFEVSAGRRVARVQPLHGLGTTETWHPDVHARNVRRSPGCIVVNELYVIDPAIDHDGNQQFQVEPYIEVIAGRLLADVVNGCGFVQFGFELRAPVARDEHERIQRAECITGTDQQERDDF